jgi:WD40 repeat protein
MTTAGFEVWFDRVSMPSRALTFHQEIRDAVAACDRLVLVVGPKAAESLYVRQEWQFAYFEAEKIVTPILRCGDYSNVPDELKLLHCEDFRDDGQYDFHLKNLIRQLVEPAPALGKLIGVPSLPPHFLSRTDRPTALRDALRADLDRPVVITGAAARVGMHGMGGIGKSVLAATLSRDRKVREAFPDGIVWVGLGPLPTVADLQRRVHKDLGGDGAFQTEHEGRVKLRDILKDKSVLLILDDVWRLADVDWFDVLGPRCRAMITTRDAGLLTSLGGVHHQVELLTDAEALNLLAQAAGVERDKLPSEAPDLIAECGRLPLAVALCGGLIRHGFAWAKVLEQLRTLRIDRIKDPHAAKVELENIWNAIDVSVKFLSAAEQARFLELAVFPPDETTPIAALRTLWSHMAGFDDWDTDALVIKLSQRSLLELTPIADGKAISLHVLVYDYVHRAAGDETALHQRLLEAYRRECSDGWHIDPPNDGYFFTHFRHHLIAAGRAGDLADLLHELRWLEAKNEAGLTFDLTRDFDAALNALPDSDVRRRNLRLLDEALRHDIQFIARHTNDYPQGLFQCLWNSSWWYDAPEAAAYYDLSRRTGTGPLPWDFPAGQRLAPLLERWRAEREQSTLGFIWLRSLRPPAVHLHTAQKAVLRGHENRVECVAWSSNSQRIVSGSKDKTVRMWDGVTGQQLLCLQGHYGPVHSVAWSGDGLRICSGSMDQSVRIWDAVTGRQLLCLRLEGNNNCINSVAWTSAGGRIVSGSADQTVRVWEEGTGTQLLCLSGHKSSVKSVAWSGDGRRIASGSDDNTLYIWDGATGEPLHHLGGHERSVLSVAWCDDHQRIVSGSADNTVRVWDGATGEQLLCLRGHKHTVESVAWSKDQRHIASGSLDKTVRVWDAATGKEAICLRGHDDWVNSVTWAGDGCHIVSGSWDNTVRVWDGTGLREILSLHGESAARGCVEWSGDGRRIATGSEEERTVHLWDGATGRHFRRLRGRYGTAVNRVAWSDDGQRLVGMSYEYSHTSFNSWDVVSWELLPDDTLVTTIDPKAKQFPFIALAQTLEATVQERCTQRNVAWLEQPFHLIAWHPSGRRFAATVSHGHLCLFTMESGEGAVGAQ